MTSTVRTCGVHTVHRMLQELLKKTQTKTGSGKTPPLLDWILCFEVMHFERYKIRTINEIDRNRLLAAIATVIRVIIDGDSRLMAIVSCTVAMPLSTTKFDCRGSGNAHQLERYYNNWT